MRKINVVLFTVLVWSNSFAQTNNFELTYGAYSLMPLSNEIWYPLIKIKNDSLWYTYEQITSKYSEIEKYGENNEKRDTIWIYDKLTRSVKFRRSSADSIVQIIQSIPPEKYLEKSEVFISNPYYIIIDGGIDIFNIKYGKGKKLKYELANTFDSTAQRIVNVINFYLPDEHKIYVPESQWKYGMGTLMIADTIK